MRLPETRTSCLALGGLALLGAFWGSAVAVADLNALYLCVSLLGCVFILRDFRVGVVLLIALMPISNSNVFPHAMLGITGFNPLNLLLVGTLALHLDISPLRVDYPLLVAACLLAFVSVIAFAITLSMVLLAGRDLHGYGEIMAQFLYLFSGAIFPISVLPGPIAWFASLSPLPYWLELCRRAIMHGQAYLMFPSLSDGEVFLRLVAATAGTLLLGYVLYRVADRRARRLGYIDMEANW